MIEQLKGQADAIVVEIHAEATSEKIALGWHLDGRVTAVLGTHTHVPTADATVLPKGTAFMCDVAERMFRVDNPEPKPGIRRIVRSEMKCHGVRARDLARDGWTLLKGFG